MRHQKIIEVVLAPSGQSNTDVPKKFPYYPIQNKGRQKHGHQHDAKAQIGCDISLQAQAQKPIINETVKIHVTEINFLGKTTKVTVKKGTAASIGNARLGCNRYKGEMSRPALAFPPSPIIH